MASWRNLRLELIEKTGLQNVYYQPPETVKLNYPCIIIEKQNYDITHADNVIYRKLTQYRVVLVSSDADHPAIDTIIGLPYCSYSTHYIANHMHHEAFKIFY